MNLQIKHCKTCGRAIEPRRKWARNWDQIRYCSQLAPGLGGRLAEASCRLIQRPRPRDVGAWPHATKGFFPFRKKIVMFLEEAGG